MRSLLFEIVHHFFYIDFDWFALLLIHLRGNLLFLGDVKLFELSIDFLFILLLRAVE